MNYKLPPLRTLKLKVEIDKQGKIAKFNDPIKTITVNQNEKQVTIAEGTEKDKLLAFAEVVAELDPDLVLTEGGDSFLFAYLAQRANSNSILNQVVFSRDPIQFVANSKQGRTYFSYGRTFYQAPTSRLFGRIHIDCKNTFIMNESMLSRTL
jgi:DNA polymerase-2